VDLKMAVGKYTSSYESSCGVILGAEEKLERVIPPKVK
jgi:hypothetical protein